MTTATHLSLRWSVSKGRETYGYNIVTLTDTSTGEKFRTSGGGYDMVGTVFGAWLTKNCQAEMRTLNPADHYGLTVTGDHAQLMGACGINSMLSVAEALGLTVETERDAKGSTTGFAIVAD